MLLTLLTDVVLGLLALQIVATDQITGKCATIFMYLMFLKYLSYEGYLIGLKMCTAMRERVDTDLPNFKCSRLAIPEWREVSRLVTQLLDQGCQTYSLWVGTDPVIWLPNKFRIQVVGCKSHSHYL